MAGFWLFLTLLLAPTFAMDNLSVRYQWKQLDFEFPTEEMREEMLNDHRFIPENNLPLGLEVYGDRLFVTVPRWKNGVAASLTYINMKETSSKSPKLRAYPNWAAHNLTDNPEIVSPFRIRADRCGRLWVLDTGEDDILNESKVYRMTTLLIYDLNTDKLLRKHELTSDQALNRSFFANIAVEDSDCEDSYAYLGDLGQAAIVVYSWKKQTSWRVTHDYFKHDQNFTKFEIGNLTYDWKDDVFGLALSKPDKNGFSTLYFHPMASTDEYSVNTRFLHDSNSIGKNLGEFKRLGSRGPKGQSGAAFLDQKTDVLFYSLLNLNAVACWRTTNPNYTMESQGRIYMSNITMVFPNDIKVDAENRLWVLSDRLPMFLYSELDPDEVNFRILTAPVADAIRGTACDSKLVISLDIADRYKPNTGANLNKKNKEDKSSAQRLGLNCWSSFVIVVIVAIFPKLL